MVDAVDGSDSVTSVRIHITIGRLGRDRKIVILHKLKDRYTATSSACNSIGRFFFVM